MHPVKKEIIDLLNQRINAYEELGGELVQGYILTGTTIPQNIAIRYETIGILIDGLHEAISIIYSGGVHDGY